MKQMQLWTDVGIRDTHNFQKRFYFTFLCKMELVNGFALKLKNVEFHRPATFIQKSGTYAF